MMEEKVKTVSIAAYWDREIMAGKASYQFQCCQCQNWFNGEGLEKLT